jgi:hypothetical protein
MTIINFCFLLIMNFAFDSALILRHPGLRVAFIVQTQLLLLEVDELSRNYFRESKPSAHTYSWAIFEDILEAAFSLMTISLVSKTRQSCLAFPT